MVIYEGISLVHFRSVTHLIVPLLMLVQGGSIDQNQHFFYKQIYLQSITM